MEGIEHQWCARYGQIPRSVEFPEGINPIGDMNLRAGLFQRLYNNLHRELASKIRRQRHQRTQIGLLVTTENLTFSTNTETCEFASALI